MDFDVIDQLQIRYSAYIRYRTESGNTGRHYLLTDFKEACDSAWRVVLDTILFQFGRPMKLVGLINVCLNAAYSKVCVGKHLSGTFHVLNGPKQGGVL